MSLTVAHSEQSEQTLDRLESYGGGLQRQLRLVMANGHHSIARLNLLLNVLIQCISMVSFRAILIRFASFDMLVGRFMLREDI